MATVDTITAVITAKDEFSDKIAKVGEETEKAEKKFQQLESTLKRRVENVSINEFKGILYELTSKYLPGTERALYLLSSAFTKLWTALGPVGWAITGLIIAFTTLQNIIKKTNEAKREAIEKAGQLGKVYSDLAKSLSDTSGLGQRYYDISKKLLEIQKLQILQELQTLSTKKEVHTFLEKGEKATHKNVLRYLELQTKLVEINKTLKDLEDGFHKTSERQKAAIEEQKELEDELAEYYTEYNTWLDEQAKRQDEVNKAILELTLSTEQEKMDIREVAMMQAEMQLMKYKELIDEASRYDIDTTELTTRYHIALEQAVVENSKKLWMERNKLVVAGIQATANFIVETTKRMAEGEKITIKELTISYIDLWLQAIQQRLTMEMVAAIAMQDYVRAMSISAGIVALGAFRGVVSAMSKEVEGMSDMMIPEKAEIETKMEVGGKKVSTAYSVIYNYITVSPHFELLDITGLSEIRIKQLSEIIGQYLMENTVRGQFGLS